MAQTRQLVALKVSSLERLQHALQTRSTPENPVEEARLLQQLQTGAGAGAAAAGAHPGHRNVMRLVDEYILDGAHFAALELADQGDLFGVIERHGRLSESIARKLFVQILSGLRYLHDCGVAHLDLKPENLLFTSAGEVKICDFGMARVVAPSRFKAAALAASASTSASAAAELKSLSFAPKTLQGAVGTIMYQAPEVFANQPFNPFSADVYSLGVILYLLLTGGHAYELPTGRDARFSAIYSGRAGLEQLLHALGHLSSLSAEAVDLMARLMCPPAQRLSLAQLLQHPWLNPAQAPASQQTSAAQAQAEAAKAKAQQVAGVVATAAATAATAVAVAVAAAAVAKSRPAAMGNGVADMDTQPDTPRAPAARAAFVFPPAAEVKQQPQASASAAAARPRAGAAAPAAAAKDKAFNFAMPARLSAAFVGPMAAAAS